MLPVSYVLSPLFTTHFDAGLALTPSARNTAGDRANVYAITLGHSLILTAHPNVQFLVETLYDRDQVVAGFAKAGYPQHLRIVLGIAKPVAAIVLLLPGFALLKEWAYAGVTFALVMAFISAYLSGEGVKTWILPPILLVILAVSYVTRPPSRRLIPVVGGS